MTFSARRIPGAVALAWTNITAAWIIVDGAGWDRAGILTTNRAMAPAWVWSALWSLSALGLICAVWRRSINMFHVAAGLSLSVWTASTVGVFLDHFLLDDVSISPVARSLYVWMVAGQAAMILGPLLLASDRVRR